MVPLVAERMGKRIPPVMVENGPVKEVKLEQGEFDLTPASGSRRRPARRRAGDRLRVWW